MSRRYKFTILVFLLWIVSIYSITSFLGEDLLDTITKISLRHFIGGYLFYILAILTGIWILHRCLKYVRLKPRIGEVGRAWIFGSFLDNILPSVTPVGEASMSYFLNKFYGISYTKSLAAIGLYVSAWGISATLFSAISLIIVNAFIEIPTFWVLVSVLIITFFALLTVGWLLLITKKALVERIVCKLLLWYNKIYNKIKKKKITYDICIFRTEFDKSYSSLELVLKNKTHILITTIAFFVPQICHALTIYVLLLGFGVQIPFFAVLFVHIAASVSGLISLIPSGFGVHEFFSSLLLVDLFGVPGDIAIASVFLYRLIFVWTTIFAGGFVGVKQGIE